MFVDKVQVLVKAGDGGNGIVSFRHEKFIDKGGPDGGDGGRGGDVILRASRNQNTLSAFRYKKEITAPSGASGGKRRRHGKSGENLVVLVPAGTTAQNLDGTILADLTSDGAQTIIARGGKGGFGNAHFVSSRRQAPRVAERGESGEAHKLTLELKLIADIGLVGLPNAGKSTLLASISNAHPEIADYPFTTLAPNLGVVDVDEKTTLLIADIPGLIEGASQGKGLGDEFLRHIERTSILVHLIDVYQSDLSKAYRTIQKELQAYKIDLTKRPQVVVLNKIDGLTSSRLHQKQAELQKILPPLTPQFAISATSHQGVPELLFELKNQVSSHRKVQSRKAKNQLPILGLPENDSWQVKKHSDRFLVTGSKIERFAARTDFNNAAGIERLRDIMQKNGIMNELERLGIEPGQSITIGKHGKYKLDY